MPTPRERMVVSAALLIRERGAQPTAIADVLAHSGAPRGSAYHYFPGGRTQLLCEAIDFAGEHIARRIERASNARELLDTLIDAYCEQLLASDYRAGCPVVAVTVEAGDPDKPDATEPVIERAAAAFARWNSLIAAQLVADGVESERADPVAMLLITAIEGAIVVARASRDLKPLDVVRRQLHDLIESSTAER